MLDSKYLRLLLPIPLALAVACGDDDPDTDAGMDAGMADTGGGADAGGTDTGPIDMGDNQPGNIVEVAQEAGLTELLTAATTAGLADTLTGAGPFTVFAPTNAAFEALGANAPTDPDLLANVLLNHVVPGTQDSAAVLAAAEFTTAANVSIAVDAMATPPTIGGAALNTDALDVPASNGIVHVINEVIIPPTIAQAAGALEDLSTLNTAVGAASAAIAETLSGSGPITVFAPTNAAFEKIPMAELQALLADQAALDEVLSYHVAMGQALSGDLSDGQMIVMANGDQVTVSIEAGNVSLVDARGNSVSVIATDIRLLNGTVHLIDTVLLPAQPNIVEVAQDFGLTELLTAATAAGLADTLATGGPFTVFAPTDAAFQAIAGAAPTDPDLLANVLLAHVVPGIQDSTAVLAAADFATAAGIDIVVDAGAGTIGGAALDVGNLDIPASNGIIHVLNDVIIPPTIAEAAGALPDLSTLNTAVAAASPAIGATLGGPDAITVFAPVNSAFMNIPAMDLNNLLANQGLLDDVLSYHVATGQTLAGALSDGQVITMANGATITVNISGADVTITDGNGNVANVIATDIRLLNGTVHLIDQVIFSGDIVERSLNAHLNALVDTAAALGLAPILRTPGPFTVFAPTDAAFAALGDISGVSNDVIANILLHHVVAGENDSVAVLGAASLTSVAKTPLAINAGPPITIGGAALGTPDVFASNGVVHIMEAVMVPPTIVAVAQATPDLSSLVTALLNASPATLTAASPNTLAGDAPITVFAPTNAAFTAAGIDPANTPAATLDSVLAHHVVGGQTLSTDLTDGQVISTLNQDITVNIDAMGNITVTDASGNVANVVATLADIRTLTGVVHVIDGVLLPQ